MAYYAVKAISQRYNLSARLTRYLFFTVAALLVVGVLIVLGRLPVQFILAPLGLAATFLLRTLPTLLRLLPMWQMFKSRLSTNSSSNTGNASKITTAFLAMELDHDSGELTGTVIAGEYSGIALSTLTLQQLLKLRDECAADKDSLQVLEAYLDRYFPQWQEQSESKRTSSESTEDHAMSKALAMEILGLEGELSKAAIRNAHRSLMQKLHPDRGGSEYLAKKINQAKETLLAELDS